LLIEASAVTFPRGKIDFFNDRAPNPETPVRSFVNGFLDVDDEAITRFMRAKTKAIMTARRSILKLKDVIIFRALL
jgi:hypothetical protein